MLVISNIGIEEVDVVDVLGKHTSITLYRLHSQMVHSFIITMLELFYWGSRNDWLDSQITRYKTALLKTLKDVES